MLQRAYRRHKEKEIQTKSKSGDIPYFYMFRIGLQISGARGRALQEPKIRSRFLLILYAFLFLYLL